jgi:hypothetical protein
MYGYCSFYRTSHTIGTQFTTNRDIGLPFDGTINIKNGYVERIYPATTGQAYFGVAIPLDVGLLGAHMTGSFYVKIDSEEQ